MTCLPKGGQHALLGSDSFAEIAWLLCQPYANHRPLCPAQVVDSLRSGHQAMVFVHSRKDTGKTGRTLVLKYQNAGDGAVFDCSENPVHSLLMRDVKKSRNKCVESPAADRCI